MALITVQLESCDENKHGSAWYGYFEQYTVPKALDDPELRAQIEKLVDESGECLGIEFAESELIVAPTVLSKYAKLHRCWIGNAV